MPFAELNLRRPAQLAAASLSVVLGVGLAACGGPASNQSVSTTSPAAGRNVPAKSVASKAPVTSGKAGAKGGGSTASTATTTTVRITPVDMDQGACRSFTDFDAYIKAVGEIAPNAAGQVAGMIQQAQQAHTDGPSQASTTKLLTDLQALLSLTNSKEWTGRPTMAQTPQFAAVAVDCKAFPTRP